MNNHEDKQRKPKNERFILDVDETVMQKAHRLIKKDDTESLVSIINILDAKQKKKLFNELVTINHNNYTLLMLACAYGSINSVEVLIKGVQI